MAASGAEEIQLDVRVAKIQISKGLGFQAEVLGALGMPTMSKAKVASPRSEVVNLFCLQGNLG